jgi:hypothetical protein
MVRQVFFSQKEYATYFYRSLTNNNSSDVASTNIDLFKSLDIKCVDFLSFSRLLIFQYSILQITRLFG